MTERDKHPPPIMIALYVEREMLRRFVSIETQRAVREAIQNACKDWDAGKEWWE